MIRALIALVACALLLVAEPAWAALIVANYCVNYTNLDYDDVSTGDLLTGSTMDAHGVVLRFIWSGGQTDIELDWNGAEPGCKDITIQDSSSPFEVRVLRRAVINGNTIEVVNASEVLLSSSWLTAHSPVNNGFYGTNLVATDSIHVLTAAGYALSRKNGGVTGETFRFIMNDCQVEGYEGQSCEQWPQDGIYIDDGHYHRKFIIAHEFGHAIADAANGGNEDDNDTTAHVGDCTIAYEDEGHKMNSKEFQSEAAVEAMGDFYSALAFNHDGHDQDCMMEKHYQPDWDGNGNIDADDVSIFSCEVGVPEAHPAWGPSTVDSNDYTGDYCVSSGFNQNRGTEYDWLRMFWDLHTSYDVSTDTIYDIWNEADPNNWLENGVGSGAGYPANRMSDAAFDVGGSSLQDDYDDNAIYNGTWR